MKNALRIILPLIFVFYLNASATIINIPGDYLTIQLGIDASSHGDTVLVQPGTYVENINFNGHSIVLGSLFLTTGDRLYISSTVIDGNSSGTVITIINQEDTATAVIGFTIQNGHSNFGAGFMIFQSFPTISNNIVKNNIAEESGGAIECYYADARIENNIIKNNFGKWKGGGIYSIHSEPIICNNVIMNNSSDLWGAGITCYLSDALIINNTLYHNNAPQGGGIACWLNSNPIIKNTILWRNLPSQVYLYGNSVPDISYCDVEGGWEGIGNIDSNPKFRNYGNDFRLKSSDCGYNQNSPCIDAGDPTIQDILLDCDWGLGLQLSDMGAYGGGDSTMLAIEDFELQLPGKLVLLQNYPNPFNAQTTISYVITEPSDISITIYNILGQQIKRFVIERKQAGTHTITWNANNYPSGIYFGRLESEGYYKSVKMLLLK